MPFASLTLHYHQLSQLYLISCHMYTVLKIQTMQSPYQFHQLSSLPLPKNFAFSLLTVEASSCTQSSLTLTPWIPFPLPLQRLYSSVSLCFLCCLLYMIIYTCKLLELISITQLFKNLMGFIYTLNSLLLLNFSLLYHIPGRSSMTIVSTHFLILVLSSVLSNQTFFTTLYCKIS